jgi:hypothetical protein
LFRFRIGRRLRGWRDRHFIRRHRGVIGRGRIVERVGILKRTLEEGGGYGSVSRQLWILWFSRRTLWQLCRFCRTILFEGRGGVIGGPAIVRRVRFLRGEGF